MHIQITIAWRSRVLCGGAVVWWAPGFPGVRQYEHRSAGGQFALHTTITNGAVILFEVPQYDASHPLADAFGTVLYHRCEHAAPKGTHAEHYRRCMLIAGAMDDAVYLAERRIEKYLNHATILRGAISSLLRMRYTELRDYIFEDLRAPYVVACLVAAHFAPDGFKQRWTREIREAHREYFKGCTEYLSTLDAELEI
jgi:hypothetical protein